MQSAPSLTCNLAHRDLLYEEQPDAYKSIDIVIDDMVQLGLIDIVAVMTPIMTYKCQTPSHDGDD